MLSPAIYHFFSQMVVCVKDTVRRVWHCFMQMVTREDLTKNKVQRLTLDVFEDDFEMVDDIVPWPWDDFGFIISIQKETSIIGWTSTYCADRRELTRLLKKLDVKFWSKFRQQPLNYLLYHLDDEDIKEKIRAELLSRELLGE